MKRLQLAIVAMIALAACEDGPTQTFNNSPNGAGGRWNDGQNAGSSDPATQGFNQDVGGNTKQEICTAPQQKTKWASAFAAPILPPRKGANLDLAGSDKWEGITVEQAELVNCQSANYEVNGSIAYNYWGDNGEVFFWYRLSNRKIGGIVYTPGYTGTLDFHSRDGNTDYRIGLSAQIKKGAKGGALNPMILTWDPADPQGPGVWANEITDALFATFMPGLPAETNCLQNAHCIIESFGDAGGLFVPALGLGFDVDSVTAPQPTPSTVSQLSSDLSKVLPFSQANPMLKLDAVGPRAVINNLGPSKATCDLKMGLTYGDLLNKCVRTSGVATDDDAEQNKLLGGLAHGTERFSFDLSGVDVNFTDNGLAPDNVVRDKDVPTPDDIATRFDVDQSTLGQILNDHAGNDATQPNDYHGTGLILAEYVRLVQNAINAATGGSHALGDPACLTGSTATMAAGCTGFEGFVIPLDPAKIADPSLKKLAVLPTDPVAKPILDGGGMKPGHQKIVICNDVARTKCTSGDTFPTSFARIVKVLGKNNAQSLPPSIQDGRFFFQQWSRAFFKYMLAENLTGSITHTDVMNAPLDANELFFDSVGAGQFETAEYVDRRFVTATEDPMDVDLTVDVKNGIFNDYDFSRDLLRGESAIYTAMRPNETDPVGAKAALLSNVFGSPILTGNWHDHDTATAYECATGAKSIAACEGEGPPSDLLGNDLLDDNGLPLFSAYKDAFKATGIFRLGGTAKVDVTQIYAPIQSANVEFVTGGGAFPPKHDFLVPWLPKQPGVGFPIAISGTIDKFISSFQLDFTGNTISAAVDYDWADPKSPGGTISLLAVESNDFLGEVFLCNDGATGDVLHVRMYTPAADILDWLAKHPGTTSSCGIVVRYSPYNNFPDYISSLTNGVRLGITQGGGFGRVVDVILFVPGQ